MKPRFRNANISLAVTTAILIVGIYLFRSSGESALQLVMLFSLIVGFTLLELLNVRDERRGKGPQ